MKTWCTAFTYVHLKLKMLHHFVTPIRAVTKCYVIITLVQLHLNLDVTLLRNGLQRFSHLNTAVRVVLDIGCIVYHTVVVVV